MQSSNDEKMAQNGFGPEKEEDFPIFLLVKSLKGLEVHRGGPSLDFWRRE